MKVDLEKHELRGCLATVMHQRQQLETGTWSQPYQDQLKLELKLRKYLDKNDNV